MTATDLALAFIGMEKRATEYSAIVDHMIKMQQPDAVKSMVNSAMLNTGLGGALAGGVGGGAYGLYRKHKSSDPEKERSPIWDALLGALAGGAGGTAYGYKRGIDSIYAPMIGRNTTLSEVLGNTGTIEPDMKRHMQAVQSRTGVGEQISEAFRLLANPPPR